MTHEEKTGAVIAGLFLGFLLFFDLIEQQKQETEKLRRLRQKLNKQNINDSDLASLRGDWDRVNADLRKASIKIVNT